MAEIVSQMNNNRLSNSGKPLINRMELLKDIDVLLSLPSNYEIAGGTRMVKYELSLSRNI